MNIGAVSNLFSGWAQSAPGTANPRVAATQYAKPPQAAATAGISPLAQYLSKLQQLQQQDPNLFKQLTSGMAARLRSAAQQAQARGDSGRAAQLNQLAAEFQQSTQTGQMPALHESGSGAASQRDLLSQMLAA